MAEKAFVPRESSDEMKHLPEALRTARDALHINRKKDTKNKVVQNSQELGREYVATHSSARSFVRTMHSFACSALLASLARSAALIRLRSRSPTHFRARGISE